MSPCKSDDAKRALMADARTSSPPLRLQVQWALGRVSDDPAPAQRLRLFEGLIGALEDPQLQVRQVAIQALSILTHQTKGYFRDSEAPARSAPVAAWRRWLVEYRAKL